MREKLQKNPLFAKPRGAVVLVIMDGVGIAKYNDGDATAKADMPNYRRLLDSCPHTNLKAHGMAVGLPSDDDMGNSEVGHNAIGAGRVFAQGAKLVEQAIENGSFFGSTWEKLVENVKKGGENATMHFIGLASDANVHSNIAHLYAMMRRAKTDGIKRVRIHTLLDGRDTPPHSALEYIAPLMEECAALSADRTFDAKIASGGGRQYITMDRYQSDWEIVNRGWKAHVLGQGRQFADPITAIETMRKENNNPIDQDLNEFVIAENGRPIGVINDGDSVILFNFRGDRAIQISNAFTQKDFTPFDRVRFPRIEYAGMMQYDGDSNIPPQYLVSPPQIDDVMGQYMADLGLHSMAVSETQKYGHVTYFFNGNRMGRINEELEDYVEIKSHQPPFDKRPEMKCQEITDTVVNAMKSCKYDFIRINYPNGDMVGHTGNFDAVVKSMEALDKCLGRLAAAADETGAILVITADHGNAEDKYERNKDGSVKIQSDGRPMIRTAHSLNPVPLIIYNSSYKAALENGGGLSSIAATCFMLMGWTYPHNYDKSVFKHS